MDYIRVNGSDRLELIVDEDDHVYAELTPSGVYRVYHRHVGATSHTHTDLFVVPNQTSKSLTVMAMSGLFVQPTWQVVIPVREEDQPFLLPYADEEQLLTVRDVDRSDYPVTLRHVQRMQFAQGLALAKNGFYRANMSDRRRMMHGIMDWLQVAWKRYQLGIGVAKEFRRVSPGRYDDPYMDTCQPLPEGWEREIMAQRSKIVTMLDEYEMRTDMRPRPDDFWQQWHRGWETDIIPTLQTMAAVYGWARVHNPREVADKRV